MKMLRDLSSDSLVRKAIKANWENYHYCLAASPSVELSIGRYLTWFITNIPDHFMNLVVCTQLPPTGAGELIEQAMNHFRSLNIGKVTWLVHEGVPAVEIEKYLLSQGLTFHESHGAEMAADLESVPDELPMPAGLRIVPVEDKETLRQWIHVASVGFGLAEQYEDIWYEFFAEAVFEQPFWTYLALLDGRPVGTSQLFLSAGVAGIYNVTCLPDARGQGSGTDMLRSVVANPPGNTWHVPAILPEEFGKAFERGGFEREDLSQWQMKLALMPSS